MRYVILATLVEMMLFCVGEGKAASFDCKKAVSAVEHLICNDPDLNSYDSQLEGAYLGALDRSRHPEQVKKQQVAWLRKRDACADRGCLSDAYLSQIGLLSSTSDQPAACGGSSTPEINDCLSEYSKRADRELDRYVAALHKRLADAANEHPERTAPKDALVAFDAGQAAWVAYRKSECKGVYNWWSEGTIRGAMYEDCWLTVTKARTTHIWAQWLGFGDNTAPLMPKPTEDDPARGR